jgi:hypothetical protein
MDLTMTNVLLFSIAWAVWMLVFEQFGVFG